MTKLQRLRADGREIFFAGLTGADPASAVKSAVEVSHGCLRVRERAHPLAAIRNLYVAGCGKAAAPMARAAEEIFGEKISRGLIVVKYGHSAETKRIEILEAGHPVPDAAGLRGAHRIVDLARGCGEEDLLVFLLSGGASALLPYPAAGLTLEDKQIATNALLKSGAPIEAVNAVRKHLSLVKGGRLAQIAAPARVLCLILSDVIGDGPEAIGSGPTAPDCTTYADCLHIIRRYSLTDKLPPPALDILARGARGEIAETAKPSDPLFERVQNVVVGNNRSALTAAAQRARALGYNAVILTQSMQGESRMVARAHAELVKRAACGAESLPRPACLLSGGETTVTVHGSGVGGRNQEFVLAAALELENIDNVVVLSGGSDGTDGPTDAAGGIVDGSTIARAKLIGIDGRAFLDRNDSYSFLRAVDDLLITGPTLTNVMDLQITLIA
jgi:hydroxypyruvate reductase